MRVVHTKLTLNPSDTNVPTIVWTLMADAVNMVNNDTARIYYGVITGYNHYQSILTRTSDVIVGSITILNKRYEFLYDVKGGSLQGTW